MTTGTAPRSRNLHRVLYVLLLLALFVCLVRLARPSHELLVSDVAPLSRFLPATPPGPAAPAAPSPVRIASWNLEHFYDGRGDGPSADAAHLELHAAGAASVIDEASPDVLLLQEVENARAVSFLNERLARPYPYVYVSSLRTAAGTRDTLNLAILSRIRPDFVRQLDFHLLRGQSRPSRGTLCAAFSLPGCPMPVLVYDIHLKSNFGDFPKVVAKRAAALHQISMDILEESVARAPAQVASFILGDTNTDPETEQFRNDPSLLPLAATHRDLWLGHPIERRTTIPTRHAGDTNLVFPPSAFDRIFVSRNFTPRNSGYLLSAPAVIQRGTATHDNLLSPGEQGHVSDHYLVYLDLLPVQGN